MVERMNIMAQVKRYDELKVNDIIHFHGARERIISIIEKPYTEEYYKDECDRCIYFEIEPADEEAEQVLGSFYSHGTYGGVGCLKITVE